MFVTFILMIITFMESFYSRCCVSILWLSYLMALHPHHDLLSRSYYYSHLPAKEMGVEQSGDCDPVL